MSKIRATVAVTVVSLLVLFSLADTASATAKAPATKTLASYPLGKATRCKTHYTRIVGHHLARGKQVAYVECVHVVNGAAPRVTTYPLGSAKYCKTDYTRHVEKHLVNKKLVRYIACVYTPPAKVPAPVPPAPSVQVSYDAAFQQSLNWAGFSHLSTTGNLAHVSGQWVVPKVNCAPTPNAISYSWVGMGGYLNPDGSSTGTLLQTGTSDSCVGGVQSDTAWWEEYPANPSRLDSYTQFPISVGDVMAGSVFLRDDGSYETQLSDLNTGLSAISIVGVGWEIVSTTTGVAVSPMEGSTVGLTYSGGSSAEWILEDAAPIFGTFTRFANFGSVTFSQLATDAGAFALTPSEGSVIVRNGIVIAVPTDPAGDNSFTVTYED